MTDRCAECEHSGMRLLVNYLLLSSLLRSSFPWKLVFSQRSEERFIQQGQGPGWGVGCGAWGGWVVLWVVGLGGQERSQTQENSKNNTHLEATESEMKEIGDVT